MAGGWRRLHNEMRWAGHVLCTEEIKNSYKALVVEPEGTNRYRCKDNIRMDLR
jgi:hypothetical protein